MQLVQGVGFVERMTAFTDLTDEDILNDNLNKTHSMRNSELSYHKDSEVDYGSNRQDKMHLVHMYAGTYVGRSQSLDSRD